MKIIAIATHKGGPGKTTTAINLSAYFAIEGKNTQLIDLDPQGHASLGLGVDIGLDVPTIADALQDKNHGIEKVKVKINDTLQVIPSNIRLARVAESLYGAVKREERLATVLRNDSHGIDFTVIDCPPSLGTLTANALTCADLVIIPCEMGARAGDGLVDLLETLFLLKGDGFKNWKILLNKIDPRKTVTNEAVMKSLEPYKQQILKTQIGASEVLNQSQMAGIDIFRFDPKGKAAETFQQLGREILNLLK